MCYEISFKIIFFGKLNGFSKSYDRWEFYESHLLGLPTQIVVLSCDVIDALSFVYGEFKLLVLGGNGGVIDAFTLKVYSTL